MQQGARATLAVRPERIRLTHTQPDDTPNAFQGRVVGTVYVGTDTRYLVQLAPTVSLQVRQQNVAPVGTPALTGPVDKNVWISWPPDCGRVLME